MEKLFSYGTLQLEQVQLKQFGRKLTGHADTLVGYEIRDCMINDQQVLKTSSLPVHPIACFTGNKTDKISGMIFELTYDELTQADAYEVDDYQRIKCTLKSGTESWIYVQSRLNINTQHLQQDSIKLELFQDKHIPALCELAVDNRIWQHHRLSYNSPTHFENTALLKAKESIAKKSRYMFVIYYQGRIIGSTSYYDVNLKHLSMYIGYTWFHPDYWGKGINPIIKNLMISYAFKELKFKRVAFCVDAENLRSRAALEKLNIPLEGILKKHQIRPDSSSRDSAIYAVTKE